MCARVVYSNVCINNRQAEVKTRSLNVAPKKTPIKRQEQSKNSCNEKSIS